MASKSRDPNKADSLGFFQSEKWQKIQDLLSKIIGANLTLLDPSGALLAQSSQTTASCPKIALPLNSLSVSATDCLGSVVQGSLERKLHPCVHRLHFFALKIQMEGKRLGSLVLGPVLVGNRESEQTYRDLCRELELQEEHFLDRVREIKLFSHAAISTVLDFLEEISDSFLKFVSNKKEFRQLVDGLLLEMKRSERFFSSVCSNEAAEVLMDLALRVVKGDSGSILLWNEEDQNFYIKTARGIRPEITNGLRIPRKKGVAGWVAAEGKAVLIKKDVKNTILQERLKRPEIHASFVVPMTFQDRTLGVFCLNTQSSNEKFSPDNLLLLDQLSKLASIALGRLDAE